KTLGDVAPFPIIIFLHHSSSISMKIKLLPTKCRKRAKGTQIKSNFSFLQVIERSISDEAIYD
ncbi:MAG: hypothetical protein J5706_07800, partial [Elusimicrobiales bacterium]|nr:hypothetical protein [Elusimicrobiales bacterium]